MLAAALPCGVAAARGPVVIVDARVLWSDPVLADGELVYGVEVERVVHGYAPGAVLGTRAGDWGVARFLETRTGRVVRLELRARNDGLYELLSAHDIWYEEEADEGLLRTPPGLITRPDIAEDIVPARRAGPRRLRSAVEDTSPEQAVVELVNVERWNNGALPPLKRVTELDNSSEGHSSRMGTNNFFSHCDLDSGDELDDRLLAAGYAFSSGGENILAGSSNPATVMAGWMSSPDHRASILHTSYREIGVGHYNDASDTGNVRFDLDNSNCDHETIEGPFTHYWTQNFGLRNSVYPVVVNREASSSTHQTVALYVYGAGFAQRMRFSNDNVTYSDWFDYTTGATWTMTAGAGDKQVFAQLDSDGDNGAEHTASDTIFYTGACDTTLIEDQTLDGSPDEIEGCEIIAGPNVSVTGPTTLLAPIVRLRDGFSVGNGVDFRVDTQP